MPTPVLRRQHGGMPTLPSTFARTVAPATRDRAALPAARRAELERARDELRRHFFDGIIPFWRTRGVDRRHGGFVSRFDGQGELAETEAFKTLINQTRPIWGFTNFFRATGEPADLAAARQGFDFLRRHFRDRRNGGWHWKTARDGTLLDDGKVVYGHAFVIYALSEYGRTAGDAEAIALAVETYEELQANALDTRHGGWFENLEADWSQPPGGEHAGDRKTLNTHMHVLEALTTLVQATGSPVHRRRLEECIDLILAHMLDPLTGCCRAQFALDLSPIPAVSILSLIHI
jgi:mannose/cellobiose epimerase-like protein (N-acyl-D-glucosamine 2-epimerase family)